MVKWPKKVGRNPLLKMFLASEKPRFYAGLLGVVTKKHFSLINCEKIYILIINRKNFGAFGQKMKMGKFKEFASRFFCRFSSILDLIDDDK